MRAMATPTGQLHVNKCACIFSISILCKLTNVPVHLYLVLTYLVRFCPHRPLVIKKICLIKCICSLNLEFYIEVMKMMIFMLEVG